MTDRHLDGNGVAGMLGELLAVDATTLQRRCQSCREEFPLGSHRAYHGAATTLRCPACEDVAVLVAVRDDELTVEWRGTYRFARVAS